MIGRIGVLSLNMVVMAKFENFIFNIVLNMSDYVSYLNQQRGAQSRPTFEPNDQFMSIYNSLGADYRKQLDPYMSYNYQSGFWDRIGNSLGFNTKEDTYRMQMQMLARQMAAGLYNDQFQNDYNSAAAQAARERAAGLNPDLTGTGDSDPAAQMEQPPIPAPESLNPVDGLGQLASLFSGVTSGIGSIATFAKTLADINNVKLIGYGQEISNVAGAAAFINDQWLPNQNPDLYPEEKGLDALSAKLEDTIKNYSPKVKDYYRAAFKQFAGNPEAIRKWRESAAAAAEAGAKNKVAQDFYGNFRNAESAFAVHNKIYYSAEMQRLTLDAKYRKMWSDYQLLKTENDYDFEWYKRQNNLPEALAESEYATYMATKFQAELDKIHSKYQIAWNHYVWKHQDDNNVMKWLANGMFSGVGYSPLFQTNGGFNIFGSGFRAGGSSTGLSAKPAQDNLPVSSGSNLTSPEEMAVNAYKGRMSW